MIESGKGGGADCRHDLVPKMVRQSPHTTQWLERLEKRDGIFDDVHLALLPMLVLFNAAECLKGGWAKTRAGFRKRRISFCGSGLQWG